MQIIKITLFSLASVLLLSHLTACGQSGPLMLPSDPNMDKRSNYLLYKQNHAENSSTAQTQQTSSQVDHDQAVEQVEDKVFLQADPSLPNGAE